METDPLLRSNNNYSSNTISVAKAPSDAPRDSQLWRDLVAFWFLGLCNNYGYVVMLCAAQDILEHFNGDEYARRTNVMENDRKCNLISTGAILLADIIPSLIIKAIAPFLPFYIHVRALLAILLQVAGFLLVAYANNVGQWMAVFGVILTSFSGGLGEASFLAYSASFNKNVVSTWSSGTGGAGLIGSLSYAGLIALGLSTRDTMLIMIMVPVVEGIAFWCVLRIPVTSNVLGVETTCSSETTTVTEETGVQTNDSSDNEPEVNEEDRPLVGLKNKIKYIPSLFKYAIPLTWMYFLVYLINQGFFELIFFEGIFLDKAQQYRWLQVDYQIGVFISRSSVNLITIDKIWLMAVFQALNVVIFLCEVLFSFIPSFWIVIGIVFWEGLLGGGSYVNTFYRMSKEIPEARRNFAMSIVPSVDTIGIGLAGIVAIPMHNALCSYLFPS